MYSERSVLTHHLYPEKILRPTNKALALTPGYKSGGFSGTKIHLFESGVKYLNFGATYLSFGAICLTFGAIYLTLGAFNLKFGAKI